MHADVLCPSSRSVDGNSCSAGYWSRETANRHAGSNHPAVVERYTKSRSRLQTTDTGLGECDGTRASSRVQDTYRFDRTAMLAKDTRKKICLVNSKPSPSSCLLGSGPRNPKRQNSVQAVAGCVCSPGFSRHHANQRKKHV